MAETGTQPACPGGQCGVSPGHGHLQSTNLQLSPAWQRNRRKSVQDEGGYGLRARLQILSAKRLSFQDSAQISDSFIQPMHC